MLTHLAAATYAITQDTVEAEYCEHCTIVIVPQGDKYCQHCTQILTDELAAHYTEQQSCESGAY